MEPRGFDEAVLEALEVGAKITDGACPGLTARRLRGGVVFEWRGRMGGRKLAVRIGRWPQMPLATARRSAEKMRAVVAAGGDPRGRRPSGPTTTGAALEQYGREHLAFRRTGAKIERALRRGLAGVLELPLEAVGRDQLKAAVEPYKGRGQWASAHAFRARLWAFMRWAEAEELIERAPGRMRLPVPSPRREHVPSVDELRALFDGARALRARHRAFVRVLMLGGFRRMEAAGLRPEEWQGEVIVLPPERTKQGRLHTVPVTAAMAAELPALVALRPLGGFSRIKGKLVAVSGVEGWNFHDFRRGVRSHLRDAGVDRDVLERILGHVVGGAEGHYDYAKLLPQMREALELWACSITRR